MNFKGQLQFWLLLAVGSSTNNTLAFQPSIKNAHHDVSSPSISKKQPLDMTATVDASSVLKNDIDISDVLAETEAALAAAQFAVPSSDSSIGNELNKLVEMKNDMTETLAQLLSEDMLASSEASDENTDQLLTTAVVGSALGVVGGAPLVLGAALGVAGTRLLEGENGEQAKEVLAQASKVIGNQVQTAASYAQEQIEQEDGDISKVSEKMLHAFQEKINHDLQEAQETIHHVQEEAKDAPQLILNTVKETLEREDVKAAPGRAFNAFKAFLGSEEVKLAQQKALQAIKDGLESEEMQALKSRASKALEETTTKKTG